MFLFQSPSIFPLNRFIRLHGVNHNTPFPTALKPSFRLFQCFRIIAFLPYYVIRGAGQIGELAPFRGGSRRVWGVRRLWCRQD